MSWFAGTFRQLRAGRVVYHESHDEAGNSSYRENGQDVHSARTIMVAVNNAPLIGETRSFAEARVHFAAGVTLLGPAPPMFFMGEEVGAWQPYRYNDFINFREDFPGLRAGRILSTCGSPIRRCDRTHPTSCTCTMPIGCWRSGAGRAPRTFW